MSAEGKTESVLDELSLRGYGASRRENLWPERTYPCFGISSMQMVVETGAEVRKDSWSDWGRGWKGQHPEVAVRPVRGGSVLVAF